MFSMQACIQEMLSNLNNCIIAAAPTVQQSCGAHDTLTGLNSEKRGRLVSYVGLHIWICPRSSVGISPKHNIQNKEYVAKDLRDSIML